MIAYFKKVGTRNVNMVDDPMLIEFMRTTPSQEEISAEEYFRYNPESVVKQTKKLSLSFNAGGSPLIMNWDNLDDFLWEVRNLAISMPHMRRFITMEELRTFIESKPQGVLLIGVFDPSRFEPDPASLIRTNPRGYSVIWRTIDVD